MHLASDYFILILCLSIILYLLFFTKKSECYNDPIILKLHQMILPLDPRLKNIKIVAGPQSYTENKEIIYLCVKDPKTKQYYDMNTLIYVNLHEASHYLTSSVIDTKEGHNNKEFIDKFNELLLKAEKLGIYDPSKGPAKGYCGYED